MSAATAYATPPRDSIADTTSASAFSSRATSTTRAPSAASDSAIDLPSPRLAPVTTAPTFRISMTTSTENTLGRRGQDVRDRANVLAGLQPMDGSTKHLGENVRV